MVVCETRCERGKHHCEDGSKVGQPTNRKRRYCHYPSVFITSRMQIGVGEDHQVGEFSAVVGGAANTVCELEENMQDAEK